MRLLLVVAFATVALASTASKTPTEFDTPVDESVLDLEENDDERWDIDISDLFDPNNQKGIIASWQARRFLREVVKQMPCGFEQYGIPPLAPYKVPEVAFGYQNGLLDTLNKVFLFRVDGLDNMVIQRFTLNVFSSKSKFDFLFPKIKITADKFETNTTIDALKELGVYAQYVGDGSVELVLQNLRIAGKIKVKVPVLIGSMKVSYLKTEITLEKLISNITGFSGGNSINSLINRKIESFVENAINSNTQKISDFIEETVKREINPRLKGKDIWSIINYCLTGKDEEGHNIVSECVPPVDSWDMI